MASKILGRSLVGLILGLGVACPGAAHALPLAVYVHWVNGIDSTPRTPQTSQVRFCDFNLFSPGDFVCIPTVGSGFPDFGTEPTEPQLPDALGGIFLGNLGGTTGSLVALTGTFGGSNEILNLRASAVHFDTANLTPPQRRLVFDTSADLGLKKTDAGLGPVLGFGTGNANMDGVPDQFIAHAPTPTSLVIDVRDGATGAFTHKPISIAGMTRIAPGTAATDFLGFFVGDDDANGVSEWYFLRQNLAGTAFVTVLNTSGTQLREVTLSSNPIAGSTAAHPSRVKHNVVGFTRAVLGAGDPPEWVVMTSNGEDAPDDQHLPVKPDLDLWRFDFRGTAIGSRTVVGAPINPEAFVVGIAGVTPLPIAPDTQCDGVDQDFDGVPDDNFVGMQTCGLGLCQRPVATTCVNGVETPIMSCMPGAAKPEQLDIYDYNCDGVVGNIPELPSCVGRPNDWDCCPTGEVDFAVNAIRNLSTDPSDDLLPEDAAANNCLPIGMDQGLTCNLRGVVRRAEQLRFRSGIRPECRVVAKLVAGNHELERTSREFTFLYMGAGNLTLEGATPGPRGTVIEPITGATNRLLFVGDAGETPPSLTVRKLTMRGGNSGEASLRGGGAIATVSDNPRAENFLIEDAILENNEAAQEGGAVQFWNSGTLTVRRSLFRHNKTFGADQNALGGAISGRYGTVSIESSAVVKNLAKRGGGLWMQGGHLNVVNTTISGNECPLDGCGIFLGADNVDAVLRFNTIVNNTMQAPARMTDDQTGAGLTALPGVTLQAFGNIVADNSYVQLNAARSKDCSVDLATVTAAHNLIGEGGVDCLPFGADPALVGSKASPLHSQVGLLGGATDSCPAGSRLSLDTCVRACASAITAADCAHALQLFPTSSPAIGAFGSSAVINGPANSCPQFDQKDKARPFAAGGPFCSIGSIDSGAMADVDFDFIADQIDGDPQHFSAIFDDDLVFGRTLGEIVDRAGHRVIVRDNGDLQQGVDISVDAGGSNSPVLIRACDGTVQLNVLPGQMTTLTCPPLHGSYFSEFATVVGDNSELVGDFFSSSFNLGSNTHITGDLMSTASGSIGFGSLVDGNARLQGTLSGDVLAVQGTLTQHTNVAPQSIFVHSGATTGGTPLAVANTSAAVDAALSQGDYGDVTVASGATIALSASGLYRMKSLIVGNDVTFVGPADGKPTVIAIDNKLKLGDRFSGVATDGSTDNATILLYTNGSVGTEIGNDLLLAGSIEAPLGPMVVGHFAFARDGIAAATLNLGSWASIGSGSNTACASSRLEPLSATSSSQESSQFTASKAIDGLSTTRWSSAFSDPQWLYVDLGAVRYIDRVALDWEAAFSSNYKIQVADSASGPWVTVRDNLFGRAGLNNILAVRAVGRYVRMFSSARATPYGNSLFELKVYGDTNATCSGPIKLQPLAAVSSSNESSSLTPDKAIDGNLTTRWSSAFSNSQWIYVDLGARRTINRVALNWEAAFSTKYDIQVSDNAQNWTNIYTNNAGDGGVDDIAGLNATGRYVRMNGRARSTAYGHSLFEFQIFGGP